MTADNYATKDYLDQVIADLEVRIMQGVGELLSEAMQMISERFDRLEERMDRLEIRMDSLEERVERIEDKLDRSIAAVDLHSVDIRQMKPKLA